MNHNSIAATGADQRIKILRATFECIRDAGLKLTRPKCYFGATEIDFRGMTITPEKPQKERNTTFLKKIPEIQQSLFNTKLSWVP